MNAILLMAHGAPENVEDVEDFVLRIRHGRPLEAQSMQQIKERYRIIGGSPLLQWTNRQAEALQRKVNRKVYFGMRHSSPYIRETVECMWNDGVRNMMAICLAPQFSTLSIGAYERELKEAIGERNLSYKLIRSYASHPGLIRAFQQRMKTALNAHPQAAVIFTAHSLPERVLQQGDPYDSETKETARLVAEAADVKVWRFAYQSQGFSSELWLGPTVESQIQELANAGHHEILIAPIGFVCDHVEILYDIDVMYREFAQSKGVSLYRTESLNDSPEYIDLLAQLSGQS